MRREGTKASSKLIMGALFCLSLGCGAHRYPYTEAPPSPPPPERLAHAILYDESPPDYRSFQRDTRFLRVRVNVFFCLDSTLTARWRPGEPAQLSCEVPDPEQVNAAAERWTDSDNTQKIGFTHDITPRLITLETADPVILEALETLWAQLADLTFYECIGCYDAPGFLLESYNHRGLLRRVVVADCSEQPACGFFLIRMAMSLQGEVLADSIPDNWLCLGFPGGVRRLGTVDGKEGYVAISHDERLASLREATDGARSSEAAVKAVVQPKCPPPAPPPAPRVAGEVITSLPLGRDLCNGCIPCYKKCRYPPTRKHW